MTGKSRLMENTGPVKFCELHVYQDNRESLSESTLLSFLYISIISAKQTLFKDSNTYIFSSIIKYEILNEHRQKSNCEFVAYSLFIVINSLTGQWT